MKQLFHGTANYNLKSFMDNGALLYPRHYLPKSKKAFCTSISLEEAAVFAFRKTPANDITQVGIVLEFDGSKLTKKDFMKATDNRAMRKEKEVAVLNSKKLKLVAYHKLMGDEWVRVEI